ncbi:hypothetical protein [Mycolicibacterium mageritense]|uniref:hypothetical protein n=1 Tax=Mycolicibacterium mageritense TaxID=53462 RepID=UPI001E47AEAA|nr:hypothetical protein [Mycolicibacterium mageritense]MCC9182566.1 hypothetical protein [Mycolicibacterium mageritense]
MPKKNTTTEEIPPADAVEEQDADIEGQDESTPEPPKVGSAEYDWSVHYGTSDLYTYTFPDGTVVAIKPFSTIFSKTWLYKVRQIESETETIFAAIDRAACETAKEVLLSLDDSHGDPINDLWKAWTSAGTSNGDGDKGLTPGE